MWLFAEGCVLAGLFFFYSPALFWVLAFLAVFRWGMFLMLAYKPGWRNINVTNVLAKGPGIALYCFAYGACYEYLEAAGVPVYLSLAAMAGLLVIYTQLVYFVLKVHQDQVTKERMKQVFEEDAAS